MFKKLFGKLKSDPTKTKKSEDINSFIEDEKKKFEQEEMKEESHQMDLKENYEQDEKYEDSKD